MEIFSLAQYFYSLIKTLEFDMPQENKLEPKEIDFLVECCLYNSEGKDLTDFKGLYDHMVSKRKFLKRTDVSTYKKKLGGKRWIRGKRNIFKIPLPLDILDTDEGYYIWASVNKRKKVTKLELNVILHHGDKSKD
jgi:hypothetical protein